VIAAGPTALWYAARSSGYVSLLLLTAIIVLGITTSVRWGTPQWPRFLNQALHRNLSLLVLVFLVIHVITVVADPFAGIGVLNAVAPFTGAYRPIWLGLGVVSLELMVALVITSLLRHRIGFRTWRVIHWAAYACLPTAVLHTLGTGSDVRSFWAIFITLVCIGAVLVAIAWRLLIRSNPAPRALWISVTMALTIAVFGFAVAGPLQQGWARSAGTPPRLLTSTTGGAVAAKPSATPTATPAPSVPPNLSDTISGAVTQTADGGVQANLVDARDANLRIVIAVARTGSRGTLLLVENGVRICNVPATIANTVTATCGVTGVTIQLTQNQDGSLSGQLQTSVAGQ
jgi:sulfoxide reductase heme-binding subunit YedZ